LKEPDIPGAPAPAVKRRRTQPKVDTNSDADQSGVGAAGGFVVDPRAEPNFKSSSDEASAKAARKEITFWDEAKAEHDLKLKDHDLRAESQRMGRLGAFFGSSWTPPMYTAAFIAVMSMVLLGVLAWREPSSFGDLQKALVGLISTSLAFLWGKGGGDRR